MAANVIIEHNLIRIRESVTAQGAAAEVTINLPLVGPRGVVFLRKFAFQRTAGAGATYAPRLGQAAAAGWVNGDIEEVVAYGATAVGTVTNEVFATPIPVMADANGRVYFRPGWNAGADNAATYEFWFEVAVGKTKVAA